MSAMMTWTKTKLRNVPLIGVDIGVNFTIAVISAIDGPVARHRGRPAF